MQFYNYHPMVDYFNSMDSETYGRSSPQPRDKKDLSGLGYGIKDVGMSVPLGISAANVAGVYSKIRMGVGAIELGFPGAFSSQRGAHTPGVYGHDQRQALREMGAINEVNFTTHAAYNVMGLMGRDERGNFSITNAKLCKDEIARAVDFAADVAGSGSIVMHTGEFERPIVGMVIDDETGKHNLAVDPKTGRLMFRKRHSEPVDAAYVLLDDRTSQVMETVQGDRVVAFPDWNVSEKDYDGKDIWDNPTSIKKGDYTDYQGKLIPLKDIYDPIKGRVPKYDREKGRFQTRYLHFDDFRKVAEEENKVFELKNGRKPDYYEKRYPEEAFLHATLLTNEAHSRGWALQYGREADERIENITKLEKAYDFYKKLEETTPKEELWKLMKSDTQFVRGLGVGGTFLPPENKLPSEWLKEALHDNSKNLEFAKQASTSQEQQAQDTYETRLHLVTPIKRLERHPTRFYAELGIRAWERSKNPDKPLYLTVENLFPDRFGGHPEELVWLIKKSREKMVEFLTTPTDRYGVGEPLTPEERTKWFSEGKPQERANPFYKPGMSKEEAAKIAETHIGVTLDTGHLNLWRKYWDPQPGLTLEQNEEAFNKWYVEQVKKLAESKMIKNVHIVDNFGFQDDHLAPGQGNAPIQDVIKLLKKNGYDKAITVEPGADASTDVSDFHGLMKAWRQFGSPVYGIGGARAAQPQVWGEIQYSYFGQNRPPQYVFGGYSPSNDWTLWSAVPME
ncbi:sugar phosphate isomerase/epimerase [Candidatus Woesearchaeota archaeon]|nr:sugar phosphate isomerase/epimerase [Candidatus Woesearchaeota archaeon]